MKKNKNYEINKNYDKNVLIEMLKNFDKLGSYVVEPGRNEIKRIKIRNNGEEKEVNVKKFKKKGFFSQLIYKYGKGSKARRSYEYGNKLLELGIQTPEPILVKIKEVFI